MITKAPPSFVEVGKKFQEEVVQAGVDKRLVKLGEYYLDPWDILPVVNFYQGLLEEQEKKR